MEAGEIRVLIVTNMWPTESSPSFGVFVREQVDTLAGLGVSCEVLSIDGRSSTFNYVRSFRPFWRKLRTGRYDLVHAHYVLAGLVARAQRRLPVVVTHPGIEALYGWQAPVCWMLSRTVDRNIVVSRQIKKAIGVESAEVIPFGVDLEFFRPGDRDEARRELGLPLDRKLVLFVAVPRPEKRLDVVEGAMDLLRAKGLPADLVNVAGQHDRSRIPLFMNACDVLVLTSDGEGSPMAIKEAMACNLPIVSVPVGDVPEVLDGVEGCYLCRQDPADVADKLELALAEPRRTNGRERIENQGRLAVAESIRDLYRDVIRRHRT